MTNYKYNSLFVICQNNIETIEDIKNQYINLLSFLTETLYISDKEFVDKVTEISKIGDITICYYINIIGSGTIIYEPKIIHGCKNVGHIEDIVVHNNYRSHGIAKNILQILTDKANKNNCYKIILDCKKELLNFYEKNGFVCNGNQMSKYF